MRSPCVLCIAVADVVFAYGSVCSNSVVPPASIALRTADMVFAGYVEETSEDAGSTWRERRNTHRVRVQEAFKGTSAGERFEITQTACFAPRPFVAGDRILFYASRHESGKWFASSQWRSGFADEVGDDLLFLRALPQSMERTRISGSVRNMHAKVRPLAGVRVTIVGEGTETTVFTDSGGVYEVYGLPEGLYNVTIPAPQDFRVATRQSPRVIFRSPDGRQGYRVHAGETLHVDFSLSEDNRISGRVLDPGTRPLQALLHWTDGSAGFAAMSPVSPDGSFSFRGMASGEYKISAAGVYYPGTRDPVEAAKFPIKKGEKLGGIYFAVSR